MKVEELLDEDALSPDKLFNEKEFSTLIIDREGFTRKENSTADLIQALLEKENSREEDETIFSKLKEANSQRVIVEAISSAGRMEDKIKLTAACWECGLDFTPYFLDFVALVMQPDFQLALEALSVVESIEGSLDEATLTRALKIAQTVKSDNKELVKDLIENIKSRIA
ncbi:MAG: hypothetical protein JNL60_04505 [Bacteroidia bacterium]|nr:hypothetical protein [Bacteroidia bacterium]